MAEKYACRPGKWGRKSKSATKKNSTNITLDIAKRERDKLLRKKVKEMIGKRKSVKFEYNKITVDDIERREKL